MMSPGNTVLQTSESENGVSGNRRIPCPLHGCKRVYTETSALEGHIKDHEIQAQSVPGKVLLCSSTGCSGSFTNMQKLMEHMRHHHKPNIYFQCESCRTKLRTYRNLLGHLHTCSKVPRGKSKAAELTTPPPTAVSSTNTSTKAMDQAPPHLESMSSPQLLPFQIANPDGSLPAAVHQRGSVDPPVLGPPILSLPETSPPKLTPLQLSEAASQPSLRNEASSQSPSLNLAAPKAAPDPPDVQSQLQMQTRPSESIHSASGSTTSSPPGSSAVWKKNQGGSNTLHLGLFADTHHLRGSQYCGEDWKGTDLQKPRINTSAATMFPGMACSRRVLWEHTRGRYTCVQCGHIVTNRKEMTQHISSKHSGNKTAEDTEGPATGT